MILSMSNQAFLFFISVSFGFVVAFIYDFIKIFRGLISHYKIFIHIEDFFYWTISAIIFFFIIKKENFGEIRGFLILGAFIGMILYFSMVSEIFLKISDKVISIIKRLLRFVFMLIFTPIMAVYRLFRKIFVSMFNVTLKPIFTLVWSYFRPVISKLEIKRKKKNI